MGKILVEDTDLEDTNVAITILGHDPSKHESMKSELLRQTNLARRLLSRTMGLIALAGLAHGGHDSPALPAIRASVYWSIKAYFNPTNWKEDVAKLYNVLEAVYVGLLRVSFQVQAPDATICTQNHGTYAYIQGRLKPTAGYTYTLPSGRPIISICPLWFTFPDRASILIHEMSHHHPTATDDIFIPGGRGTLWPAYFDETNGDLLIKELAAMKGFVEASKNADTYAQLVRRLTTDSPFM